MKKFLSFLILIILAILIVFFVKNNQYKKSLMYTIEQVNEENYFLLMQGDKYGVINKYGDIVVEPIYDIVEIPNPEKALFVCKNNYNPETKNYDIQVFNDSNNQILYQYYIVEAVKLNKVEGNGNYEKSVLKYKSNNKYGLINFEGKKITEPVYDSIEGFEYHEGLLLTKKDNKYGIININGTTILKERYDEIASDAYYNKDDGYKKSGYIVGEKTDKGIRYGYINYEGKQVLKNDFNDLYRITEKNEEGSVYLVAYKNGRAGVYKNSKNIIDHAYEDIFYNAQIDALIVQNNSKQGVIKFDKTQVLQTEFDNIFISGKYINTQKGENIEIYDQDGKREENSEYAGKLDVENGKYEIVSTINDEYKIISQNNVVSNGYSYIQYLFDGYFYATKDSKSGIIDANGNILVDFNYSIIQKVDEFNIIQMIDEKGRNILLNSKLEKMIEVEEANIYFLENYIKVQSVDNIKYFDKNGNELKNTQILKDNKLYAYKENSKWGFADSESNVIIKPAYDMVTEFNKFGYAGIKNGNKWGIIKDNGEVIKEPAYELNQIIEPYFIKQYCKIDQGSGESYYIDVDKE